MGPGRSPLKRAGRRKRGDDCWMTSLGPLASAVGRAVLFFPQRGNLKDQSLDMERRDINRNGRNVVGPSFPLQPPR
jgi:hypothetical protein